MKEIRQGNTFVEDCGLHEETDDRELCGCRLQMALTVSGADSTGRAGTLGSLGLGTAAAAFYAKRRSKILKIHTDISPLWQKLTKNLRAGFKVTHTKRAGKLGMTEKLGKWFISAKLTGRYALLPPWHGWPQEHAQWSYSASMTAKRCNAMDGWIGRMVVNKHNAEWQADLRTSSHCKSYAQSRLQCCCNYLTVLNRFIRNWKERAFNEIVRIHFSGHIYTIPYKSHEIFLLYKVKSQSTCIHLRPGSGDEMRLLGLFFCIIALFLFWKKCKVELLYWKSHR